MSAHNKIRVLKSGEKNATNNKKTKRVRYISFEYFIDPIFTIIKLIHDILEALTLYISNTILLSTYEKLKPLKTAISDIEDNHTALRLAHRYIYLPLVYFVIKYPELVLAQMYITVTESSSIDQLKTNLKNLLFTVVSQPIKILYAPYKSDDSYEITIPISERHNNDFRSEYKTSNQQQNTSATFSKVNT